MAAKTVKIKVKIDPEELRKIMDEKKITLREIGRQGIYSDKTIGRGLKTGLLAVASRKILCKRYSTKPRMAL